MIAEFIGQGIEFNENETLGNHICSALKETKFTRITFFVAFLRKPGVDHLIPFIKKAIEENRKITIYVGIDENITSKEALETLLELNIETYIYYSDKFIYHPKIYLFEGESNRIIIGSSNMTKSGLFYNVESSLLLDFINSDKSGLKVLNQLKNYYESFLNFSDSNLNFVTNEYITELFENGRISTEKYTDNSGYKKEVHDFSKKRGNNPKIENLGGIKINETVKYGKKSNYNLKITEEYLEKWDLMFSKILAFYNKHNKSTIPRDYKDKTLYSWYRKQKDLYNAGIIPKSHIEKLQQINFYFGDGHDPMWKRKWLKRFNELLETHNEPDYPNLKRYKDNKHPLFSISNWVATERGKFNNDKLKDWQIEKLESIGFEWIVNRFPTFERSVDDFIDKITLLESYKKEFGDCNVPQKFKNSKYTGLGKWINEQRYCYKAKRNILTKERIDILEEIGIIWDLDAHNFKQRVVELKELKEKIGHFNIPSSYKENPLLGNYIYKLKTKGLKEDWKKEMLHNIGFYEIGTISKKAKKGHITQNWFVQLEKLKKIENPNIERTNKEHPVIARWLYRQKRAFWSGNLKDIQIDELKKIGVELNKQSSKSKKWKDYIELIELFIKENGNSSINQDYDEELFYWIKQQRHNYNNKSLNDKKAEKLIDLGIIIQQ